MKANMHRIEDIIEDLAMREGVNRAHRSASHNCRFAHVVAGSWQADALRIAEGVRIVDSVDQLSDVMRQPGTEMIYLPLDAMVTEAVLERLCVESAFDRFFFREVRE